MWQQVEITDCLSFNIAKQFSIGEKLIVRGKKKNMRKKEMQMLDSYTH